MQTVWSRSLRPQSTCRCVSCNNPLPSILSRRTTTGVARKRLTAGNAFSLLLGPVLGGALIADTKAKDKRRKEWEEKIAAAQAEVEQIRRTSVKLYSTRSKNSRRLPALSRNYSSAAAATLATEDDEYSIGADDCSDARLHDHNDQHVVGEPAFASHDSGPDHEDAEPHTESLLNEAVIEKCKRLQRLVAIKLAIRMILHIHIGKSPRYMNRGSGYGDDEGVLSQDANELIRHLKQVSNSLRLLNMEQLRSHWGAYQNLTRGKTCRLDTEMSEIARQFRQGEMSVTQLVERFAGILLSSSESPTARGYVSFLSVLSRARFDELGFMIDGSMMEARLPYDRHSVFILLWQYGKNKEAHYFDKLITKLTTNSANDQFGEQWQWRNISDTLVPVPPSKDPQILQILIYAALKCNQPHRAEAWAKILAGMQTGKQWFSHVIRNFLKYYSAHQNWYRGQSWMKMALSSAEILAAQGIRHLQRVTFAMLEFCVAYGKRALYQDVLQAAGESRLGVYTADPDLTLTQRTRDILEEWEVCHERYRSGDTDVSSPLQKARMFTNKLGQVYEIDRGKTDDTFDMHSIVEAKERARRIRIKRASDEGLQVLESTEAAHHKRNSHVSNDSHDESADREPADGSWRTLCHLQQIQLDSLKRQLESLKSLRNAEHGPVTREHDSHFTDLAEENSVPQASASSRDTTPRRIAEDVREPGLMTPTYEALVPLRPFTYKNNYVVFSNQRSSHHLSQLSSRVKDKAEPSPNTLPPPPTKDRSHSTAYPSIQRNPISIPEESNLQASPLHLHKPTPLLRSPTLPQIDRALTLCTQVTASLSTYLAHPPSPLQPLYHLISTMPPDLLIQIAIDDLFTHFISSMLTPHERKTGVWEKLVVEVRRRRGGVSSGGLVGQEADAEKVIKGEVVDNDGGVEERTEAAAETEPLLSVKWETVERRPRPGTRLKIRRLNLQELGEE